MESQERVGAGNPPPATMVSWLPHMTSFCCCLGLEAGARVVGFLHLLVSVLLVAYCSFFSVEARAHVSAGGADAALYTTWYRLAVAMAVLSTAHVVLAATLIYGVYKRNTCCLRAWVCIMAALVCAALVCVAAASARSGLSGQGSEIFLAFAEGLLFFCVVAYCILCVNSYYMMVKSCEDMEGPKTYY